MSSQFGQENLVTMWLELIVPTLGGHFREGILALNEVFHGTTKGLQALQPRVQA